MSSPQLVQRIMELAGENNVNIHFVDNIDELGSLLERFVNKEANIIDREVFNHNLEITKNSVKMNEEIIKVYEKKIVEARKNNDIDVLFDAIEKYMPYKQLYSKLLKFYKCFYIIQISFLHKLLNGFDEKIKEIRPMFYELDDTMMKLINLNGSFDENMYLKFADSSKHMNEMLNNYEKCVKEGYVVN